MKYVIGQNCSTCHFCFNECSVGAIHFVGQEYAIDSNKCIDCGKCYDICPAGIITNTEQEKKILHKPKTLNCDLVVMGAGGSGLVAAVRYAQLTGKKVIVLEKNTKVGGSTNLGHAFVLRYSKWHEKAGVPDMREEAIETIGKTGEISMNLLRKAMYGLTDMFDWLCEFGGAEEHFNIVNLIEHGQTSLGPYPALPAFIGMPERTKNVKSTDQSMGPGWMGTFVIEKMLDQCLKLGIEVFTETQVKKLIMEEDICKGVVAEDDGGEIIVNAEYCLIASGGFSRNKEIMNKIRPTFNKGLPVHTFALATNSGDAIGIVEDIGGKIDLERVKIPMFSPSHHPYSFSLVRMAEDPRAIRVNMNGERFMNEGAPPIADLMGPMEKQPEYKGYTIIDADTVKIAGEAIVKRAGNDKDMLRCMMTWKEQLEYECTLDIAAKRADGIEELAQYIGIEPYKLITEIEKYNSYCELGEDKDFGKNKEFLRPIKKAPFYALLIGRFNEGAVGGIVNDDNFRVVKKDNIPFNGLYAVGDCCRGILKVNDSTGKFGEMAWAMASGYLAAEEMATNKGGI